MKFSTFKDNCMSNKCLKFYILPLCSSWKISKILQGGYFYGALGRKKSGLGTIETRNDDVEWCYSHCSTLLLTYMKLLSICFVSSDDRELAKLMNAQ